ncbi:MAG: hypothetical protein WBG71_00025 [Leeuwenhoekiella sp.]
MKPKIILLLLITTFAITAPAHSQVAENVGHIVALDSTSNQYTASVENDRFIIFTYDQPLEIDAEYHYFYLIKDGHKRRKVTPVQMLNVFLSINELNRAIINQRRAYIKYFAEKRRKEGVSITPVKTKN